MSKIVKASEFPGGYLTGMGRGGSISNSPCSFFLPCRGSDVGNSSINSDVAVVCLQGASIRRVGGNHGNDDSNIKVICCAREKDLIFMGSCHRDQFDSSGGTISYAKLRGGELSCNVNIESPGVLEDLIDFTQSVYDEVNGEVYFGVYSSDFAGYVVVDVGSRKFRRMIDLSGSVCSVIDMPPAVTKDRKIYLPDGDVFSTNIICFDGCAGSLISSISLGEMNGYGHIVAGIAVDNDSDMIYVLSNYDKPNGLSHKNYLHRIDSKSNAYIGWVCVRDDRNYCASPVLDRRRRIMYCGFGESGVIGIDVASGSVVNTISLPEDQIVADLHYNDLNNCLVATTRDGAGSNKVGIYMIYDPDVR
ncbi:hypothetical protein [Pandoraea iniqua]|uniref:hypothetical protein n=1 Tax=Pandoraea iniqua TaxID=2508288 RepID=UPI001241BCCE|nr:hypothetical protein [Pandoraea iniqua]